MPPPNSRFDASSNMDFFYFCFMVYLICVYVRRKVGIGSIPELHLRKVGIPTLSADSRIVSDNSRIV